MGLINLYRTMGSEHTAVRGNGKLSDILHGLDLSEYAVIKEGRRVTPDYVVEEDDVLFVRRIPEGITTTVGALVAAIGWVALAAGAGTVAGLIVADRQKKRQKELEDAQKRAKNLADSTDIFPFLRGAKNSTAIGKAVPFIMGEMRSVPYLLNTGFYSIGGENGKSQFYNAVLAVGYNNARIKDISIGNTKVLELESYDGTEPQSGVYEINPGLYQQIEESRIWVTARSSSHWETVQRGQSLIEIRDSGDMTLDGLNQKVVSELYEEEIKHDFGTPTEDIPEIIRELASNAQRVEVCVKFDGLRKYDNDLDTWVDHSVGLSFEWTNNLEDASPVWHPFYLDGTFEPQAEWVEADDDDVQELLDSGLLVKSENKREGTAPGGTVLNLGKNYILRSCSETVIAEPKCTLDISSNGKKVYPDETGAWGWYRNTQGNDVGTWSTAYSVYILHKDEYSTVTANSRTTLRFTASHTFTAAESFGKNISIRVKRTTPKLEDQNANETAVLLYVNTFCYDAVRSDPGTLVPCRAIEPPLSDKILRIGVRIIANENTDTQLDEISCTVGGTARTWNGSEWSEAKTLTRNPAAWALEVLTSDTHKHSKYDDSELDLESFGAWYDYCNRRDRNYHCDGIITESIKKESLLEKILDMTDSDILYNSSGIIEVVTDKEEDTPVALLNAQSIKAMTYTKNLGRKPTGVKVTYTDRNLWAVSTEYFMKDGRTGYDDGQDIITELAPEFITEHEHAYRYSQRQMRKEYLQPREIKVSVGAEGDYYPLYSVVLLQMMQLKIGICSSVITAFNPDAGTVTIEDLVDFEDGKRYGIIIQAMNSGGRRLCYAEVTGQGATKTLTVAGYFDGWDSMDAGNILSFGYLDGNGQFDRITSPMKITGISAGESHGWELTLRDYNPELYEVGEIPAYKTNLTQKPAPKRTLQDLKAADILDMVAEIKPGYQDYQFAVGDFDLNDEQARALTWYDAPPDVPDGKCLYMATKWING